MFCNINSFLLFYSQLSQYCLVGTLKSVKEGKKNLRFIYSDKFTFFLGGGGGNGNDDTAVTDN